MIRGTADRAGLCHQVLQRSTNYTRNHLAFKTQTKVFLILKGHALCVWESFNEPDAMPLEYDFGDARVSVSANTAGSNHTSSTVCSAKTSFVFAVLGATMQD